MTSISALLTFFLIATASAQSDEAVTNVRNFMHRLALVAQRKGIAASASVVDKGLEKYKNASGSILIPDFPAVSFESLRLKDIFRFGMAIKIEEIPDFGFEMKMQLTTPTIVVSGAVVKRGVSARFFLSKGSSQLHIIAALSRGPRKMTLTNYRLVLRTPSPTSMVMQELPEMRLAAMEFLVGTLIPKCEDAMIDFLMQKIGEELAKYSANAVVDGTASVAGPRRRRQVGLINAYADAVLASVRPALHKLDPLQLPDRIENFTTKAFLLPLHIRLNLTDGQLRGLATLHRVGDVHFLPMGLRLVFEVPLGVRVLRQVYKANVTLGKASKELLITASVHKLHATFRVTQELGWGSHPKVQEVRVTTMGHFNVRIQGLGPVDWILSRLGAVLVNKVRWDVVEHVEAELKNMLNKHLTPML